MKVNFGKYLTKRVTKRFYKNIVLKQASLTATADILDGLDENQAIEKAAIQFGLKPKAVLKRVVDKMEELDREIEQLNS